MKQTLYVFNYLKVNIYLYLKSDLTWNPFRHYAQTKKLRCDSTIQKCKKLMNSISKIEINKSSQKTSQSHDVQ